MVRIAEVVESLRVAHAVDNWRHSSRAGGLLSSSAAMLEKSFGDKLGRRNQSIAAFRGADIGLLVLSVFFQGDLLDYYVGLRQPCLQFDLV